MTTLLAGPCLSGWRGGVGKFMFNEGKVERLSTFTAQRKPKGCPPPSQRRGASHTAIA